MNNSYIRLSILLYAVVFVIVGSSRAYCQATTADKPPVIDAQLRQRLIDNITRELQARYIAPEKAREIGSYLLTKLQSGAYEKVEGVNELASALSGDLRTAGKDLHLLVAYDPALESALRSAPATPSAELQELRPSAEQLTRQHQSNYDFRKLEIMSGNVGYLDLRTFVDLNQSKETAVPR